MSALLSWLRIPVAPIKHGSCERGRVLDTEPTIFRRSNNAALSLEPEPEAPSQESAKGEKAEAPLKGPPGRQRPQSSESFASAQRADILRECALTLPPTTRRDRSTRSGPHAGTGSSSLRWAPSVAHARIGCRLLPELKA